MIYLRLVGFYFLTILDNVVSIQCLLVEFFYVITEV